MKGSHGSVTDVRSTHGLTPATAILRVSDVLRAAAALVSSRGAAEDHGEWRGRGMRRPPATAWLHPEGARGRGSCCSEHEQLRRASSTPAALPSITTARQLALVPSNRSKMRAARASDRPVTGARRGQHVSSAARAAAAGACGGSAPTRRPAEDHRGPAPCQRGRGDSRLGRRPASGSSSRH